MRRVFVFAAILIVSIHSVFAEIERLQCEVIAEIPRATKGYTQGFFILDGKLYESTGGYGRSVIRRFDLKTNTLERSERLPPDVFGEGITPFGESEILQLSWRRGMGFVHNRKTLKIDRVFHYKTEGWGITSQDEKVVMSDGSDRLFFLNPKTLQSELSIRVTRNGQPQKKLNELEWVGDSVYANIWLKDEIVKLDPKSGKITAVVNCKGLCPQRPQNDDAVLNGIAYDYEENVFYLTGKLWPAIYKVRFIPAAQSETEN